MRKELFIPLVNAIYPRYAACEYHRKINGFWMQLTEKTLNYPYPESYAGHREPNKNIGEENALFFEMKCSIMFKKSDKPDHVDISFTNIFSNISAVQEYTIAVPMNVIFSLPNENTTKIIYGHITKDQTRIDISITIADTIIRLEVNGAPLAYSLQRIPTVVKYV